MDILWCFILSIAPDRKNAMLQAVAAGILNAASRQYEKVWKGGAQKTKEGKKTAMKHFNKYLASKNIEEPFEEWTLEEARRYINMDLMQQYGGYLCEATNFDTGDLIMRDTALQYFSGMKMSLIEKWEKKFKFSQMPNDVRLYQSFFEEKTVEDWNAACRAGIDQIISERCIMGGQCIVTKAPNLGMWCCKTRKYVVYNMLFTCVVLSLFTGRQDMIAAGHYKLLNSKGDGKLQLQRFAMTTDYLAMGRAGEVAKTTFRDQQLCWDTTHNCMFAEWAMKKNGIRKPMGFVDDYISMELSWYHSCCIYFFYRKIHSGEDNDWLFPTLHSLKEPANKMTSIVKELAGKVPGYTDKCTATSIRIGACNEALTSPGTFNIYYKHL
jgi:hypothetical protein